ncbi:hypothetical protein [Aureispira anguillae]|uniref:Uncharacterized protein n=1 Tax=Aureispira anguillae TaxID=2864201 RepID=A0A915YL33_9BACT|nr:hypothetical protein [Aureispira anguillae]BDS15193.1 hypothetical protein AsAng_0059770 [Aureispira anguillae]
MISKKIILSCLFLLIAFHDGFSQGHVSQYLNQMLSVEQDPENPPTSIYIKLNTSNIEVHHMKGTRVMVTGKVRLGIPNVFFLEVLIKKGRYDLFLTPDGGSGLRLEDKSRQPMVLQGEQCQEEISYAIYVPETITSVVFENAVTGETGIINIKKRNQSTITASTNNQVLIKEK